MTNEIIVANGHAPAPYLGDRDIVAQIKQRITSMTQMPADTPDYVIWQFAQVCTAHQLNPFTGDAYIIDLGKKKNDANGQWEKQYGVHIGVKGLRKMARRQANYMMPPGRRLSDDEVRQYRAESYDPADVGYEVEIYRLDVARECKDAGIPYIPVKAVGFWRAKARYDKYDKSWKPDNLPETWTRDQVAEKRAEVSALKKAFDIEIAVGDPALEDAHVTVIDNMQERIESYDRDHALTVDTEVVYEEDGNVLFAPDDGPRSKHTAQTENAPQQPPSAATVETDDVPANPSAPSGPTDEQCQKFIAWARKVEHDAGAAPCTVEQYRYLAGIIDGLTGQTTHKDILTLLCGRNISGDNVPCYALASKLLDWLPETKGQGEEKVANPTHNASYAACIHKMHDAVMEAKGQRKLLDA